MTDKTYRYKLLRGTHQEGKYPEGHEKAGNYAIYKPGDTFESPNPDLEDHNPAGGDKRFEKLS